MLTDPNPAWILVALVLASSLFSFYTYYHKTVLGRFVRALLSSGAENPETAKSFAELALEPTLLFERALKEGSALRRIVRTVGTVPAPRRINGQLSREDSPLLTLRFYVAPEHRDKAHSIYGGEEYSILTPILITAASAVLALIANAFLPQILAFFSLK